MTSTSECDIGQLLEQVLEKYDHETDEEKHEHLKQFCSTRTKEEAKKIILEIAELIMDDPIERIKLADALINSHQLDSIFRR